MKVKLIYIPRVYTSKKPYYPVKHGLLPPLGLATLKSTLEKKGYFVAQDDLDIKVVRYNENCRNNEEKIDMELFDRKDLIKRYFNGNFPELDREIEKILSLTEIKGYDIIGLSLLGDSNFSVVGTAIVLSKLIKEKTGAIVIVGGLAYPRPLVELNEFLKKKYIDFIIVNSGINPMINLLDTIENNTLGEYKIENVFINNKKYEPKKNAKKQKFYLHMRDLETPDFEGLPLDLYRYFPDKKTKKKDSVLMIPYSFISGCINKCAFCPMSVGIFVGKKPSDVAEDIKKLSQQYKTKYFYFINTHINPSVQYTNKLYDEFNLKDINIKWTDCANFTHLNKSLLRKLKQMGAVRLVFGLESASNKILNYVNKNITIRKAENLLKFSDKLGIWNEIELVPGLPYETDKDIKKTLNFIRKNSNLINYYHLNRFVLMDTSLFFKNPEEYGLKNIKPLVDNIFEMQQFTKSFDETNGLKWKDKIKQINNSFETLDSEMRNQQREKGYYYHSDIHMPLLFYLYSKFDNKKDIENYLKKKIY